MPVIRSGRKIRAFFLQCRRVFSFGRGRTAHCVSAGLISLLATRDSTSRGNERKFDHEQFKRNSSQTNAAEAASFPQTSERNPCICVGLRRGGGHGVDD